MKRFRYAFLILLCLILCNTAAASDRLSLEDLDIQIIDTPAARSDLYYADVRDDGWFTLMTWNTNVRDTNSVREKFFDIYNAEGQFQKTVRLVVRNPVYFKLTENTLNLYIFPSEIIYDLNSETVNVVPSDLTEAEIRKLNQQKRFSVGEWTYLFKGITRPYAAFYRKNGSQNQLLVQTEGNAPTGTKALLSSAATGLFSIVVLVFLIRYFKRQKQKRTE